MKEDKIKYISLGVGAAVIVAILVWDSLTPSSYGELTINPSEVDWGLISWGNIDVNTLIHTILSTVIGFMLTIIVVEQLLRASRERELQYKRDLQFKNISKIIRVSLLRYKKAALSMTYGIGNIPADEKVHLPIDPNSLTHVFEIQAFIDEPLLETNIEFYASAVDNLQNCITNILLNVDLTDNEELSALLSDYIMIVSAHNPCRQIMAMKNQGSPKERLSDFIAREISKVDFSKVNGVNVFSPFVTLKKLIEYHESFIERLYELAPSFNIENQEDEKGSR